MNAKLDFSSTMITPLQPDVLEALGKFDIFTNVDVNVSHQTQNSSWVVVGIMCVLNAESVSRNEVIIHPGYDMASELLPRKTITIDVPEAGDIRYLWYIEMLVELDNFIKTLDIVMKNGKGKGKRGGRTMVQLSTGGES